MFHLLTSARRALVTALSLVLFASVLVALPTPPAAADHGGDHPTWDCDGIPLLMRGSRLFQVVPDPATPGELVLDELAMANNIANSTAYDPTTDLLYGIVKVGGVPVVRMYDANGGIIRDVAVQAPYPSNSGQYAGTVLGDGRFIVHSVGAGNGNGWYAGARFNMWSIDPATGASTHIGTMPTNVADISYNPLDGYLYHVVNRVLYKVHPNTGAVTQIAVDNSDGGFPNGNFGASWFDPSGFLYLFRNNPGDIWRVDVTDGSYRFAGRPGSNGGTDGTSCVSKIDITKDVVDAGASVPLAARIVQPGDTVTYRITVINNGLPTQGLNTRVCDDLPADGRTYTGTWSSSHGSAVLASGGSAGDTSVCIDVEVPSSLWTDPDTPGQPPVTIDIEVAVPAGMAPGEYANQATLDLGRDGTVEFLSDDPGDTSDPRDPTTIRVASDLLVGKTVEGHPGTPGTFDFVVACTDPLTGAAHTVDAADIVAPGGAAWPDAVANGFALGDGERVVLRGLPPDATCEVTESPAPAGYRVEVGGSVESTTTTGGTVLVDGAVGTESAEFTNHTGTIDLRVDTVGASTHPIDLDDTFSVEISCDTGDSVTIPMTTSGQTVAASYPDVPLLPEGAVCTVTETAPPGWSIDLATRSVTISSTTTPELVFTNTRLLSDLTVTKSILGLPSAEDPSTYDFDLTITCAGGFTVASHVVPGPHTVATDTDVVIADLPRGTECTVVETAEPGFVASYSPADTITLDEATGSVDITNQTGSLVVRKDAVVDSALPVDLTDTFEFEIICVNGATTIHEATHFVVTDALVPGGAAGGVPYTDLPLLPPGTTCTATEQVPAGWTPVGATTVSATITAEVPEPELGFTNEREVADLDIDKVLAGVPAGLDLDAEPFDVDVTCTGDFIDGSVGLDGAVSVDTSWTIEGIPTGASCTVVETADPRFTATNEPAGPISIDAGGIVTITNTTSSFTLTKTTTASDASIDLDGGFEFGIDCGAGSETVTIDVTDGIGAAAVADLPLVAPGTSCTIRETDLPTGWTIDARTGGTPVGGDGVQFTTSAHTPVDVGFVNRRDVAELTITKVLAGVPAGIDLDAEAFTVAVSCTGGFEGGTFDVPGPLTVSVDTPLVVGDIPTGSTCTVTEADDPRFAESVAPADPVLVSDGGASATLTNTTSAVGITKTVTIPGPHPLEGDGTFDFAVSCVDGAGTEIGAATPSITTTDHAGAWAPTAAVLVPPGTTCTVTETAAAGWTIVGDASVDVVTDAAVVETADFVNELDTVSLTIDKTLVGIPDGLDFTAETFTVDVTCTGGFTTDPTAHVVTGTLTPTTELVIDDLPVGTTCDIVEQADSRFVAYYNPDDDDRATVTLDADAEAGIINAGGTLVIRKNTSAATTHDIDLFGSFDFRIDCGAAFDEVRTIAVDQVSGGMGIGALTWTELPVMPVGTSCTITEVVPAGWNLTSAPSVTLTVQAGDQNTASFDNERRVGSLVVDLDVVGAPPGVDLTDEPFTITITCTGDFTTSPIVVGPTTLTENAAVTVDDLPTGADCTVATDLDGRFTITDPTPVTIVEGANTRTVLAETSSFEITKTATADGDLTDLAETFTFEVTCTGPGGVLFDETVAVRTEVVAPATDGVGRFVAPDAPLLPPGTECEIAETAIPTGWTPTSATTAEVTTSTDAPASAAFTNHRETGDVIIRKQIVGAPDTADLSAEAFPISVVCIGDVLGSPLLVPDASSVSEVVPVVITDVPTGTTCAVAEEQDRRFTTTYPVGSSTVVGTSDSLIIVRNATGVVELTKTTTTTSGLALDLDGSFDLTLVCNDGDEDGRTDLTVTLDIVDGVAATVGHPDLPLLPDGMECTVTEDVPTGWTLTGGNDRSLTISSDGPAELTFSNDRNVGSLTITKTVLGAPDAVVADTTFTVDVTCTGGVGGADLRFDDVAIRPSASATIDGLPTGSVCTVVEDADPRFTTSYSPAGGAGGQVTIDDDGETVAVVNATGDVLLTKINRAPDTHPVDRDLDITFRVVCSNGYDESVVVPVDTAASATTTVGSIGYDDLPLLPSGTTCSATETVPTGWSQTSAPAGPVTVDPDTTATLAFENTRDTAELTITVDVLGATPGLDLSGTTFDVTVVCDGGFDTVDGTHTVPGPLTVSETTPLVIADLPVGTSCTVTQAAEPGFAVDDDTFDVTLPGDGAEVAFVDRTSTISITKTTEAADTHPIVVDDTFTFDVDCDGTTTTIALTTTDGATSVTTPNDLHVAPGTTCSVTERALAGWSVEGDATVVIDTDEAAPVAFEFTNVRDTADLTVTKTLDGVPAAFDLDDEAFDIDITCTGDVAGGAVAVSTTVTADTPVVVADLPTGSVCTVVETQDPRFTTSYSPASVDGTAGELTLEADGTIEVTNTTSTIGVTLDAVGPATHDLDLEATFSITISCVGPDTVLRHSETLTLTTDGAVAVAGDDHVVGTTWGDADAPLLPPGSSCTITQSAPPTGWTLVDEPSGPLTTVAGTPAVAEFVDRRDTAALTITKTLDGVPAALDLDDVWFDLTITCAGDFEGNDPSGAHVVTGDTRVSVDTALVVDDLPTGAVCDITESADPRFAPTYSPPAPDGRSAVVVVGDAGASAAVENATGSMIIAKRTVAPTTHPIDTDATFSFRVDCGVAHDAVYDLDVSLATADGSFGFLTYAELPLLADGTSCTVTELDAGPSWTLRGDAAVTLTVSAADPVTAEFVNERRTGAVEITKSLAGVPAGVDLDAEPFDVTVVCSSGFDDATHTVTGTVSVDEPFVIADLPSDATCVVTEAPDDRFGVVATPADGTVRVAAEDTAEVGLENRTGTIDLDITTVAPATHPIDLAVDVTVTITCLTPSGGTGWSDTVVIGVDGAGDGPWDPAAPPLLAPGSTCQVVQSTPAAWTLSDTGLDDADDGTVTSPGSVSLVVPDPTDPEADTPTATFELTRDTAALTITKLLDGVAVDTVDPDRPGEVFGTLDFPVTVACTGDFVGGAHEIVTVISGIAAATVDDLPTGATCVVTESPDPRFAASSDPIDGTVLVSDAGAEVTVTNATGTFILVKATTTDSDHPVDLDGSFRFHVVCDDGTDEIIEVTTDTDGPEGREGSVAWAETGYHPAGTSCTVTEVDVPEGWTPASTEPVTVTFSAVPEIARFTNIRDTAEVRIDKTVVGAPDAALDDLASETFDATLTCEGDFVEGSHTVEVELSTVSPAVVGGLPTGAVCTLVEADDERFLPVYEPVDATVTVDGVDDAVVGVENRTAELVVRKTTRADSPLVTDLGGTFRFAVRCDDGYATTFDIEIPGAATTSVAVGYPDLPLRADGTGCSVTELSPGAGWAATVGAAERVLSSDEPGELATVNTREAGTLVIVKSLRGAPVIDLGRGFDISVRCVDPTGDVSVRTGVVTASDGLSIPAISFGSRCVVSEDSGGDYLASYPSGSAAVVIDAAVERFDLVNTHAPESTTRPPLGGGGPLGPDIDGLDTDGEGDAGEGGDDEPTDPLAYTGAGTGQTLGLAVLLLALGFVFLLVGRSRRHERR